MHHINRIINTFIILSKSDRQTDVYTKIPLGYKHSVMSCAKYVYHRYKKNIKKYVNDTLLNRIISVYGGI